MNKTDSDKNNKELRFLNERIIKYRKEDVLRLILLVTACAVIFGIVACVTFLWAKPYFREYFSKAQNVNGKDTSLDGKGGSGLPETFIPETPFITGDENEPENETSPQKPISAEYIRDSVVTILCESDDKGQYNDDSESHDEEQLGEGSNEFVTSGLVLFKGESIYILASYDEAMMSSEVMVCFDVEKSYAGQVEARSEDYKIAIIVVKAKDVPAEEYGKIKTAVFTRREEYQISEKITFIGNSTEKKIFMTDGLLTLVGNTVSIMDAEAEILTTDIAKAGEVNGFAFDETGCVIGMVNNGFVESVKGGNVISLIKISDLGPYIDSIARGRQVPYIGIYGREVTEDVIENIDNKMPYGIYISYTKENSPAYLAGIMNGDVLVSINDEEILDFGSYIEGLHKCEPGQDIVVTVMRKGRDGYKQIKYGVRVSGE